MKKKCLICKKRNIGRGHHTSCNNCHKKGKRLKGYKRFSRSHKGK